MDQIFDPSTFFVPMLLCLLKSKAIKKKAAREGSLETDYERTAMRGNSLRMCYVKAIKLLRVNFLKISHQQASFIYLRVTLEKGLF